MFTKFSLRDYNFKLFFTVVITIVIGIVCINSADSSFTVRQVIGAVMAVGIMAFVSAVDYEFICKLYMAIYGLNAALLLSVLLFGVEVNSATRWINIGGEGGVQFQPSEFSKIMMIVCYSTLLAKLRRDNELNTVSGLGKMAVTAAIPLGLIVLEPDLSTTLCLTFVLLTLIYLAGISYKLIAIALLVFVPVAGSFIWYIQRPDQILLKDYQVARILQFIYPYQYGEDYSQQNNSIIAIGSGELTGKGLNSSTIATVKDANFISEQQTDFIFSVIGEELGFVGSVFIVAILLLLVLQCISVGRKAKDLKGMLIASGVACLIGYQSFINIGVATGLLPNTGIPLPFISYGLSSLVSVCAGMGIVLNISLQKKFY
ncbi:MAG: rod shape-determining protein RodA [Lachnospiraceae bacterium]|nr:rod shape-determining protein RodA [Lachnospiraceae bacterium]